MFGEHVWLVVSGYGVVLLVLGVLTAIMGHRRHQDRHPRTELAPPMISRVRTWCRTWWATVPDPRDVSLAWAAIYAVFAATGVAVLCWPPRSLVGALDSRSAVSVMCVLLIMGSMIGGLGGWREYWRLERVGLLLLAAPTVMYGSITLALHVSQPGSRLWTLGYITIGLLVITLRWVMIRGYTYRPGSRTETGSIPIIREEGP